MASEEGVCSSGNGIRRNLPRLRCVLCGTSWAEESDLEAHIGFEHLFHTPFPCTQCRFVRLPSFTSLQQHWINVHRHQYDANGGQLDVKVRMTNEFLSKEAEVKSFVRISLNRSQQQQQQQPILAELDREMAAVVSKQNGSLSGSMGLSVSSSIVSCAEEKERSVEVEGTVVPGGQNNATLDEVQCSLCFAMFKGRFRGLANHVRSHMLRIHGKDKVDTWRQKTGRIADTKQFKQLFDQSFPTWNLRQNKDQETAEMGGCGRKRDSVKRENLQWNDAE